ncbi:MAG: hypothetical protein PHE77_00140 [Candidatus Pacebacteria bacterium]|nr:hypothetical protein [Candidatus Paceibacterota bacterium]
MSELSLVLQKEQEIKEKIEAAKKEADLILQEKKAQLEKKLGSVSLKSNKAEQLRLVKEEKFQALETLFQEKNRKALNELSEIKKAKFNTAVNYLTEKILCLK